MGDSAKHFRDDVSTTVSQNVTTGSATLISKNKKNVEVYYTNNLLTGMSKLRFDVHVFLFFFQKIRTPQIHLGARSCTQSFQNSKIGIRKTVKLLSYPGLIQHR